MSTVQRLFSFLTGELHAGRGGVLVTVTDVTGASVRNPGHVVTAAKMGAHVATLPPATLKQMFQHPLTDKGLAAFLADWAKTGQSILGDAPKAPRREQA